MKVFLFVLAATVLEAAGDAIVRIALHHQSLSARIGLFLLGYILLALYGTSLNLAPVEFAAVTAKSQHGEQRPDDRELLSCTLCFKLDYSGIPLNTNLQG